MKAVLVSVLESAPIANPMLPVKALPMGTKRTESKLIEGSGADLAYP